MMTSPTIPDPVGAHEIYADAESAYRRVATLLHGPTKTVPPEPVRLRELRALRGISQAGLAETLKVQQAAVSRLEGRKDRILLSSLKAFVAAMGGELKLTAKFPDGEERPIQLEDGKIDPAPPVKTRSAAG